MSIPVLKICGITSVTEAESIADVPIQYAGLNFIASSSRYVTVPTAQAIAGVLKPTNISLVALIKDLPIVYVKEVINKVSVDYVQLNGEETAEYARSLGVPIIRSVAVHPDMSTETILEYIKDYPAEYFILDRFVQGQGDRIDIELARKILKKYPDRIFLAGGLNPDNLRSVIEQAQPFGIDIASGVRTDNQLDVAKIKACLTILSNAGPLSN